MWERVVMNQYYIYNVWARVVNVPPVTSYDALLIPLEIVLTSRRACIEMKNKDCLNRGAWVRIRLIDIIEGNLMTSGDNHWWVHKLPSTF